jgi:hypothetical protein
VRHPGRKLLVLANVSDDASLQPYLPHSCEFQVLLTTRKRVIGNVMPQILGGDVAEPFRQESGFSQRKIVDETVF